MNPPAPALRFFVIGGCGYIGSEVCRTLAEKDAHLAFTYHKSQSKAVELTKALPASQALRVDLTKSTEIIQAIEEVGEQWGGIDALIHCAGITGDTKPINTCCNGQDRFLGVDESSWDEMADVTAKSAFIASQAASRFMRQGNGGNIIFIGSMAGVKPVPAPVHFAASHGSLRAMAQALAQELGRYKILVNMLALGILDGGVSTTLTKNQLDDYLKHCSLKRLGTAREAAQAIAWFARENTYVSGQTILWDGGL